MTFESVTKTYDGSRVPAVVDLNWTVKEGTITALAGESGSGKTTTLRLISGLEIPEKGRIVFGETVWVGPGVFVPPEGRRVRMVFQDFALFPHWTCLENLTKTMEKPDQGLAKTTLSSLGLEGLERRYPHELSGGQKQRLALARAVVEKPSLLLLDEPFNNLDRKIKSEVIQVFRQKILERGHTALVVTHEKDEAYGLADHLAFFEGGRLLQEGTIQEVYENPRSLGAALFFEKTSMIPLNKIPPIFRKRLEGVLDLTKVCTLGLRPWSITLLAQPHPDALLAKVLQRRFHGSHWEYKVELEGGGELWFNSTNVSVEDHVFLGWDRHQVLGFSDTAPNMRE